MSDEKVFKRPKDEGEVDKRRFAAVMGLGTVAMVVGVVTFFSIGMVGAALGVGIGGFVANFEEVSYNDGDASIYPVIGPQAACDDAPQLKASLAGSAEGGNTTVLDGGIEFFKDLPLPGEENFGDADMVRLTITADGGVDGVEIDGLDLRLTALEANTLSIDNADIQEFGPGDYEEANADTADGAYLNDETDPDFGAGTGVTPEFGIEADSFNLPDGGSAAAHSVALGDASLNDVNLGVQILDSATADQNGPADRTVATGADCADLADNSTSNDANDWSASSGGLDLIAP